MIRCQPQHREQQLLRQFYYFYQIIDEAWNSYEMWMRTLDGTAVATKIEISLELWSLAAFACNVSQHRTEKEEESIDNDDNEDEDEENDEVSEAGLSIFE